jgi:hypothetical protein
VSNGQFDIAMTSQMIERSHQTIKKQVARGERQATAHFGSLRAASRKT